LASLSLLSGMTLFQADGSKMGGPRVVRGGGKGLSGITRYGSYLPYFRLQRSAIGAGRGERAVASYDEDSVSMAVEASRDALRDAPEIDTLIFATTSPPYAEKLNAATLQAALNLDETVRSLELGASSRMGLGALLLAADIAAAGGRALAAAAIRVAAVSKSQGLCVMALTQA